jgi:hypothetical protein
MSARLLMHQVLAEYFHEMVIDFTGVALEQVMVPPRAYTEKSRNRGKHPDEDLI